MLALEPTLEMLVAHHREARGDLEAARAAFHERTGAFVDGDPWYEERIRAFFDDYLCTWRPAQGGLDAPAGSEPVARACARAARGLFAVRAIEEGAHVLVADELFGMRVRLPLEGAAARLRLGDVFDGRVLVVDDRLLLAPGIVFHPAETHEALSRVISSARDANLERDEVLDGLLRMRMRLDRFTSIRARHVYRFEALLDREILSAGWARKSPEESQ